MAITMRQLVGIPDLRLEVHAGGVGLDREIRWAHVSELRDPTKWLDSGELLMTSGLGIPAEPDAQRAYVERMAEAGLSGLLISRGMNAPELSMEMTFAADGRSLPVLLAPYEVPFTAVARAIADANSSEERRRLAAGGGSGSALMARLGTTVGCRLYVLDLDRGLPLLPGGPKVPEGIAAALEEARSGRDEPLPAVLRFRAGSRSLMAVAVPASRPATMITLPEGEEKPDLSVLRHVASVAALEIEKEHAEREKRRRLGSETLAGLVDGRLPAESAAQLLADRNLGEEPRVLAACAIDEGEGEHSDLHLPLEDRAVPHLLLRRAPLLTVLLPDTPEALGGLREEVDPALPIGLSDPLGRVARAPDAQREARLVLGRRLMRATLQQTASYGGEGLLDIGVGELQHQGPVPRIVQVTGVVREVVAPCPPCHRVAGQFRQRPVPVLDGFNRPSNLRHGIAQVGQHLANAPLI
ncbi:MAG: PucR family transcriptional regulator ligand-binding domain-containing protein [Actinomycetota bacterium]|nr:PucR family transcriptional regulator ligand-binding domain-containing protein [Actinomycetota bacterium]